tara:strand:+ start:2452 stop:2766 length:315 start_codon:yes stop_codon:yes gene_type:complete
MSLKDAQKDVHDWVSQFEDPYFPPLSIIAQLSEELGELSREINNRYGGRVKKSSENTKEIGDEIADVIFALNCLANSHDVDLDEAWKRKMDKCYGRDKDRYKKE